MPILNKAAHIATPPRCLHHLPWRGKREKQYYQTNDNSSLLRGTSSSSDVDKKFTGNPWWKAFLSAEGGGFRQPPEGRIFIF